MGLSMQRSVMARLSTFLLLAALPILAGVLPGVPRSVAIPAVAAAEAVAADGLELQNLDGVPYNDRLVFQRINSQFDPANTHRDASVLVKNIAAGQTTVTASIEGGDAGNFEIRNADARVPFVLAPGGSKVVQLRFIGSTNGSTKGLRRSSLILRQNDATKPARSVELSGYNFRAAGGNEEPTLQETLNTFGYEVDVIRPGEGHTLAGTTVGATFVQGAYAAVGDEVLSKYWRIADNKKPVVVRQLAAIHGCCGPEEAKSFSMVGKTFVHRGADGQSFLPRLENVDGPAGMTFTSGNTERFVITASGMASNRTEAGKLHASRYYPARDRQGRLIPNSYILGQDYTDFDDVVNWDYQDNIYLITNIKPDETVDAHQPAAAPGAASLVLNFDKSYDGPLKDATNKGIGFSEVQRNKNDFSFPNDAPTRSFDASRITLTPTGEGTLAMRSSQLSNANSENQLVNGLCLPYDGHSGRYTISTRLKGPFTNITALGQQQGLMIGPNMSTYIKLTAGAFDSTGQLAVQLAEEKGGVLQQIGTLATLPNKDVAIIDLQLTVDTTKATVEGAYRIGTAGVLTQLPTAIQLDGRWIGRYLDPRAKGCVLAAGGNPFFTATFDRFAIEPAAPVEGLPTVSAGPDQKVALGATVALQGSARDANGVALTGTWQQVSGPSVQLSGSGNTRTFTAPGSFAVLSFALGASDAQNRSASDTVVITVGDGPISGLAVSAEGAAEVGAPLRLAASVTAGAEPIVYEWDFGDGSAKVTGGASVGHRYTQAGIYSVTVKATNAAGSASAKTPVQVTQVIPNFALRYDIGSTADRTVNGVLWKRDAGIYAPSVGAERRNAATIANVPAGGYDAELYRTYRGAVGEGNTFTLDVPLGLPANTPVRVDVRLHFAEVYWGGSAGDPTKNQSGRRIFDINIEGNSFRDRYDIFAVAGTADKAVVEQLNGVLVADGKLTVSFLCRTDNVSVAGIEVLKADSAAVPNGVPTAYGGADRTVPPGTAVTLEGSGSDPDGDALSYSWSQLSGPSVTLGGSGASRSFTPTRAGSYVFALAATDVSGLVGTDEVTVTVPNRAPTANAGADQAVKVGTAVTLSGSGSDPDGDALSYTWQQPAGQNIALSGEGATRSFSAATPGTYLFTLVVSDGISSAADSITVAVTQGEPDPSNTPPTASAGSDARVTQGTLVILNGSGSDPNGDQVTFSWQQLSGPEVTLAGSGANRTFTAEITGTYIFTLVATDSKGASSSDSVAINVIASDGASNSPPVANAGPALRVGGGTTVTLQGGGSDPDGDQLAYSWQQVGGPPVTLSNANSSQPSFAAPTTPGVLTFQLVVVDIFGVASTADQVTITVTEAGAGPPPQVYLPLLRR